MQNPPSGIYMEYNPNNWTKNYPKLAANFPGLASKIEANKGTAVLSPSTSHTDILKSILDKLK